MGCEERKVMGGQQQASDWYKCHC